MKRILATVLVASAAAAVALFNGCGGGSGTGGGGGSVSLAQFPAQYASAMCTQNFKCCSADDINSRTMQECVDNNTSTLMLLSLTISSGQSAGRVSYNAAQMGMCIAALKQMTCDDWKTGLTMAHQPAACSAAVTAKVATGGTCNDDSECTTGHCDGADSSATPPRSGTCTALVSAGGSCAVTDCAGGLYCTDPGQTCAAKKPAGAVCTSDDECMNSCNTGTGMCSCYAGCAVGGALSPRPPVLALALLGAALLFGKRKQANRSRVTVDRRR